MFFVPWFLCNKLRVDLPHTLPFGRILASSLRDSLMVKQRTLTPSFLVRVQVPQLGKRLTKVGRFYFKWCVLRLRRMN